MAEWELGAGEAATISYVNTMLDRYQHQAGAAQAALVLPVPVRPLPRCQVGSKKQVPRSNISPVCQR